MGTHRLNHISHRYDACIQQNLIALESIRIAAAIHALMVLQRIMSRTFCIFNNTLAYINAQESICYEQHIILMCSHFRWFFTASVPPVARQLLH